MKIGVLGAGRMTAALVPHWVAAGHRVVIGGRTPATAQELADRVGADSASLREVTERSDVVLLAVLYQGIDATLDAAGAADAADGTLAGKVVIDCNNAVEIERFTLDLPPGESLAGRIAATTGARVAKAFHNAHADVWATRARYDGRPLVAPIAGDAEAKTVAARLVRDVGAEPFDAGGMEHTLYQEAASAVIIRHLFAGADPLSVFQLTVGTRAASGRGRVDVGLEPMSRR
jgi:predicted dinucleotide-binding enzyme